MKGGIDSALVPRIVSVDHDEDRLAQLVLFQDPAAEGRPVAGRERAQQLPQGGCRLIPPDFARAGDPVLLNWDTDPGRGYAGETGAWFPGGGEAASLPETGVTTGLAISFDTWSGNALPDGTDIEGIIVRVDNKTVLRQAMPTRNGAVDNATSLQTGPRETAYWSTGEAATDPKAWATLGWAHLSIGVKRRAAGWWCGCVE